MTPGPVIPQNERTFAALTHLSGLSGYIVPIGGVVVPIVIWAVKRDSPVIAGLAKQAILLNVVVFCVLTLAAMAWMSQIVSPWLTTLWFTLATVAVVLPIVGALKANRGAYYQYPIVGVSPR